MSTSEEDDNGSWRNLGSSLGSALGGFARRVGEIVGEVSGSVLIPEHLRSAIRDASDARLRGDLEAAEQAIAQAVETHGDDPLLHGASALGCMHAALDRTVDPEAIARHRGALEGADWAVGLRNVLSAIEAWHADRSDDALDHLRRAARELKKLPAESVAEAATVFHMLVARVRFTRREWDRATRELALARTRIPEAAGPPLREKLVTWALDALLAEGRLTEADRWLSESMREPDERRPSRAVSDRLLARLAAARGDAVGAHGALEALGDSEADDAVRLRVGIQIGLPEGKAVEPAGRKWRDQDGNDAGRARLWALASLYDGSSGATSSEALPAAEIVDALDRAIDAAPRSARERHLQELVHVALRLNVLDGVVAGRVEKRLKEDEASAAQELRVFAARVAAAQGDADRAEAAIRASDQPTVALGNPPGPDEVSPLRNPGLRASVLASQQALARAEVWAMRRQNEAAEAELVTALTEMPQLAAARDLLSSLARPSTGTRLEDLLGAATSSLAAIPRHVLDLPVERVQDALSNVVAARERLARPLTIAVMGEFSSGKSTLVNVLLGEEVAPMGVLPTTSTINVFRRGTGGGARVHYRDGSVSTLAGGEVQRFLHGLDDVEAGRIRHMEIERAGARMGDASVVDTPGLNALDPYHEQVAREFLEQADAVVWVFSATRSGAASEADMLAELRDGGRKVLGVLNKVDTLDEGERKELAGYLQEQLGEVLVDIVPVCARDALEHRQRGAEGDDPFSPVEQALEREFLAHARELKVQLTARRLAEALGHAREGIDATVAALEARASAATGEAAPLDVARDELDKFADRLAETILELDDVLLRESLAIGVLQPGGKLASGAPHATDLEYLTGVVEEAAASSIRRCLVETSNGQAGALVVEDLSRTFVPWALGHIDGVLRAGLLQETLREAGRTKNGTEAAVRAVIRSSLEPTARTFRRRAKDQLRSVELAVQRAHRQASLEPAAEALRLRTGTRPTIDAIIEAAIKIQDEQTHDRN